MLDRTWREPTQTEGRKCKRNREKSNLQPSGCEATVRTTPRLCRPHQTPSLLTNKGEELRKTSFHQFVSPLKSGSRRKTSSRASPGRCCALPVAYLSKVTTALADALRKTPASAFTPVLHSHISFPHPLRVPSTPPHTLTRPLPPFASPPQGTAR